ncbi:protein LSM12 homolog A-like isoform X2 [Contarinia nasturtii]|uniref:protein LSM12 homolog A-like isoform X2 n=1 Tax=Contarinia nasturtii TaxID=265458 RepID=UPI0012D4221B|nr:protein LSM12 homolog A-like isoform X2 [Contarinia nasturtii]
MAGGSECFSIGSTVSCTTCFKQVIEGLVMAFDPSTKMLILKCTKSGKQLNDVFIINLGLCSDVQVKNEINSPPTQPPPSLNLQRLNTRVRNSVDDKKLWVAAMSAGVSPEGKKLFLDISRMIKDVTLVGTNIVVFNDVQIRPPYRSENVCGHQGSKQLNYVRKLVERLTKDRPVNSHHSLMQSQPPLPQRRNSNGNGPAANNSSSITSSTKITERNTNANIKAN